MQVHGVICPSQKLEIVADLAAETGCFKLTSRICTIPRIAAFSSSAKYQDSEMKPLVKLLASNSSLFVDM